MTTGKIGSAIALAWLIAFFVLPDSMLAQRAAEQEALLAQAGRLAAESKLKEARELYKQILRKEKKSVPALLGLGRLEMTAKSWSNANDYFEQVLEIEPRQLEALYGRGVCYRETGKFKAWLLQKIDFGKAEKHFREVLAIDSSYADVLYQSARLERLRGNYRQAISLCHEQIVRRPELVEPRVQLFRFYQYLIEHEGKDDAFRWLQAQPWPEAAFGVAEWYRRNGELDTATARLRELISSTDITPQPPLLALAKTYAARGQLMRAQQHYWQAIESIADQAQAEAVLEDVKYIMSDLELDEYRRRQTSSEWIDFFRNFWRRRDPMPAADSNARLAEHFRRMLYAEQNYRFDGVRSWVNNPDKLGYLDFPESYSLNNEFNDKGLIYLRHGEPDDRIVTVNASSQANESWRYYRRGPLPELVFHFVVDQSAAPGNWRVTAQINDLFMASDRIDWDHLYFELTTENQLGRLRAQQQIALKNQAFAQIGFSTDRHSWQKDLKPLNMPFYAVTFRGLDRKTELDVFYGLQLAEPARQLEKRRSELVVERGFAIYDTAWARLARESSQKIYPVQFFAERENELALEVFEAQAPPGNCRIAFHAKPLDTDYLGGFIFNATLPDYSQDSLALSDLLLAYDINEAAGRDSYSRHGLRIKPNPARNFRQAEPVHIYFEIYNLRTDAGGKTAFEVDYRVSLKKEKAGFFKKLFGGGESTISTASTREGSGEFWFENIALDISGAKKGEYELAVTVTDKLTGQRREKTTKLFIY